MWTEMNIDSRERVQFIDITAKVEAEVTKHGISEGVCYLFVPHTTAGITINENADPDVVRDLKVTLEKLIPKHGDYRHGEGNSDAHIKASLMGFSCTVPIKQGHLDLGTWQGIYFCEFDGPRHRKMKVGILG